MSVEQAKQFVTQLNAILQKFKVDCADRTDEFTGEIDDAYKEFIDSCHAYAKDMTGLANEMTTDIQAMYQSIYGGEDINGGA